MAERTRIGAGDDKDKAVSRVENSIERLRNKAAFEALGAGARQELLREAVLLILRVLHKRLLK